MGNGPRDRSQGEEPLTFSYGAAGGAHADVIFAFLRRRMITVSWIFVVAALAGSVRHVVITPWGATVAFWLSPVLLLFSSFSAVLFWKFAPYFILKKGHHVLVAVFVAAILSFSGSVTAYITGPAAHVMTIRLLPLMAIPSLLTSRPPMVAAICGCTIFIALDSAFTFVYTFKKGGLSFVLFLIARCCIYIVTVVIGLSASFSLMKFDNDLFERFQLVVNNRERTRTVSLRKQELIQKILPRKICKHLVMHPSKPIARLHAEAAVMFCGLLGVTSDDIPTHTRILNDIWCKLDMLCEEYRGLEKIKTIGDVYMCATNILEEDACQGQTMARFALKVRRKCRELSSEPGLGGLNCVIGIASGPVVSGVLGYRVYSFDIWGDAVNTASRMKSNAAPGEIRTTTEFRSLLGDRERLFNFSNLGSSFVKGKGMMECCSLDDKDEGAMLSRGAVRKRRLSSLLPPVSLKMSRSRSDASKHSLPEKVDLGDKFSIPASTTASQCDEDEDLPVIGDMSEQYACNSVLGTFANLSINGDEQLLETTVAQQINRWTLKFTSEELEQEYAGVEHHPVTPTKIIFGATLFVVIVQDVFMAALTDVDLGTLLHLLAAVLTSAASYHAATQQRWRSVTLATWTLVVSDSILFIYLCQKYPNIRGRDTLEGLVVADFAIASAVNTMMLTWMLMAESMMIHSISNIVLCCIVALSTYVGSGDLVVFGFTPLYAIIVISVAHTVEYNYRQAFVSERIVTLEEIILRFQEMEDRHLIEKILPAKAALHLLGDNRGMYSEFFQEVSFIACDICGFTSLSASMSPLEIVRLLNTLFMAWDAAADKYNILKIKTIGDAYLAAGNVIRTDRSAYGGSQHIQDAARFALCIVEVVKDYNAVHSANISVRVGLDVGGPAVAAVTGNTKYCFDLWGSPIDIAQELESSGVPNEVHVSQRAKDRLGHSFLFEEHSAGEKGSSMRTFLMKPLDDSLVWMDNIASVADLHHTNASSEDYIIEHHADVLADREFASDMESSYSDTVDAIGLDSLDVLNHAEPPNGVLGSHRPRHFSLDGVRSPTYVRRRIRQTSAGPPHNPLDSTHPPICYNGQHGAGSSQFLLDNTHPSHARRDSQDSADPPLVPLDISRPVPHRFRSSQDSTEPPLSLFTRAPTRHLRRGSQDSASPPQDGSHSTPHRYSSHESACSASLHPLDISHPPTPIRRRSQDSAGPPPLLLSLNHSHPPAPCRGMTSVEFADEYRSPRLPRDRLHPRSPRSLKQSGVSTAGGSFLSSTSGGAGPRAPKPWSFNPLDTSSRHRSYERAVRQVLDSENQRYASVGSDWTTSSQMSDLSAAVFAYRKITTPTDCPV